MPSCPSELISDREIRAYSLTPSMEANTSQLVDHLIVASCTHRYYNIGMQLKLLPNTWSKDRFAFGGALLKNSHAKTKRIFRPALPLHIVIRSTQATGKKSLLLHGKTVAKIIEKQSTRHHVRIYGAANAGNHIHLLVQAPSREQLSNFLRAITGRIAQFLHTGSGRVKVVSNGANSKTKKNENFWDARPFTRIVSWGRDFKNVARYLGLNSTEMVGMSRENVRHMFEKIRQAMREGLIPHRPDLIAAGFG